MNVIKKLAALLLCLCLAAGCSAASPERPPESAATKTVTDMRGAEVEIPEDPQRVAILDKGFIVQTMAAFGVADRIAASGDLIQTEREPTDRDSLYLCPELLELPQIGYPSSAVDYETLAAAAPDLVLLCNSEYIMDSEITAAAIEKIEGDLGLPLVVINGPGCYGEVRLETAYEGVRLLGEVFGMQERAEEVVALMSETIKLISERTAGIAEEDKPSVMYLGGLTGSELAGSVWGENYGDAKFSSEVAHIKNVHPVHEVIRQVSAEQIIALDPEVIILCTVSPDPETFLSDALYEPLRNVAAVRDGRVASIGQLTWWGDFRLEAPTILLISAKAVYPELFADINVGEWLDEYHIALYGLSEAEARELKAVQELDWMDREGF